MTHAIQLNAAVSPVNATNKTVKWTSSNTSIAYVSSSGVVTALGEGSATIIAEANGKTAACTVNISHKKQIPNFTARMFSSTTYERVILLIIKNNGTKPMVLSDYVLLETNNTQYGLYPIDDNAYFVNTVIVNPGEEARIGLCQRSYGYFFMNASSICAFAFTYDGVGYIAGTDYYGNYTTYKERDENATSLNINNVSEEVILSEEICNFDKNQEANRMDILDSCDNQSERTIKSLIGKIDNMN